MTTATHPKTSLLGKMLCFFVALAVVIVFCSLSAHAAPVTQTLSQPSGVPTGLVNYGTPSSTSTLYTAVAHIENDVLLLNQEFIYQKPVLDYIAAQLDNVNNTLNTSTPTGITLDQLNTALDTRKTEIISRINAMDIAIQQGSWAIVGSLWALIFAVTWKG